MMANDDRTDQEAKVLAKDSRVEVVTLGTGTSHGVPMIGCRCPVCTSDDPCDK